MSAGARNRWLVPVVVAVLAALVGSVTVILFVDTGTAAGAAVVLEPARSTGADPFTRSVTIGELADFPGSIHPITRTVTADLPTDPTTGGLTATGNAPGLYGGTGDNAVCDPGQLATFLAHNPGKAAAWAAVLGITTSRIPTYIKTLTPVVLTTDTRVTNHGYTHGGANPRPAVLQAGTAVLVDPHGIPRVKCGCGNPLTEPASQPIATTTGTPWTGYQPDQVTTITPTPKPQDTFTLTNITTGTTYTQPTGTGTGNGTWLALLGADDTAGTAQRSTDNGRTWAKVQLPNHLSLSSVSYGDRRWIGLGYAATQDEAEQSPGTVVLTSDDGRTWRTATTVGLNLTSVAYGAGKWLAVGNTSSATGVVYASSDGSRWEQVATSPAQGSDTHRLTRIVFGDGTWVVLADDAVYNQVGGSWTTLMTSSDGRTWKRSGRLSPSQFQELAFGSGEWRAVGPAKDFRHLSIVVSTDLVQWTPAPTPATPSASAYAIGYGDGSWMLAGGDGQGAYRSTVLTSADGQTWTPTATLEPLVGALASGG